MASNLERYRKDLDALIEKGEQLHLLFQYECLPDQVEKAFGTKKSEGMKAIDDIRSKLRSFETSYQDWYSEAKSLVRQLLPDRLEDFVRHYEKPKGRKDINFDTYRIEDALQGINVTKGWEKTQVVGREAAIPHLRQQCAMLGSAQLRFESSLFDIRQLVQADLFDSELEAARELARKKFLRAAGAIAGVVLEGHLAQVCVNHKIQLAKKSSTISAFNDALKAAGTFDTPQWRQIQHLGDIRNLCDHSNGVEPTVSQIDDLILGVSKVTKTIF